MSLVISASESYGFFISKKLINGVAYMGWHLNVRIAVFSGGSPGFIESCSYSLLLVSSINNVRNDGTPRGDSDAIPDSDTQPSDLLATVLPGYEVSCVRASQRPNFIPVFIFLSPPGRIPPLRQMLIILMREIVIKLSFIQVEFLAFFSLAVLKKPSGEKIEMLKVGI